MPELYSSNLIFLCCTALSSKKDKIPLFHGSFTQKNPLTFCNLNSYLLIFLNHQPTKQIPIELVWLSLPGDYRVTDEALLAETT